MKSICDLGSIGIKTLIPASKLYLPWQQRAALQKIKLYTLDVQLIPFLCTLDVYLMRNVLPFRNSSLEFIT